jgi:hypothetical protein
MTITLLGWGNPDELIIGLFNPGYPMAMIAPIPNLPTIFSKT